MLKYPVFFAAVLLLAGCASNEKPAPTSLELQAIQSRDYESTKAIAFAATLSVFQDTGYIIQTADKDTGFITAQSPTDVKADWLFTGNTYNSQTKATAFIEDLKPGLTRVRLNFVAGVKSSSVWGQESQKDNAIYDAKVYGAAFEKIEDAIFIRSGTK